MLGRDALNHALLLRGWHALLPLLRRGRILLLWGCLLLRWVSRRGARLLPKVLLLLLLLGNNVLLLLGLLLVPTVSHWLLLLLSRVLPLVLLRGWLVHLSRLHSVAGVTLLALNLHLARHAALHSHLLLLPHLGPSTVLVSLHAIYAADTGRAVVEDESAAAAVTAEQTAASTAMVTAVQ